MTMSVTYGQLTTHVDHMHTPHLKLVKAQHSPFRRKTLCDFRKGIRAAHPLLLVLLPHPVLTLQDVEHETVEVDPGRAVPFRSKLRGQGGMKQVHQHGLSRPHGAVEVQTLGDFVQGQGRFGSGR